MLDDKTREIVRDILTNAVGDGGPGAPLINFSGISGSGHTFHVHITTGVIQPCPSADTDRQRRLAGINARLRSAVGGHRKFASHLRKTYGVDRAEHLGDEEIEQLYAWVHNLPMKR